jgi:hypothetical protein
MSNQPNRNLLIDFKGIINIIPSITISKMLKNAPIGWKVNSVKKAYSSELIEIYEDTLDLEGKEKIYIRGIRKDYSTIVPFVSKDEILVIKSYRLDSN